MGLSASNSCYVSDGVRKGCHWSLLVLDLEAHHAYYGDSLAWPTPDNLLETVYSCVHLIEQELSVSILHIFSHIISIHGTTSTSHSVPHTTESVCFYPLQSCSTVCGDVVIAMTALLCHHKEILLKSKQLGSLGWLSMPSKHSDYSRMAIMDWILLETVNIDLLGLGYILRSQLCSKEEPTQQSSEELDDDFQITRKYMQK